MDQPPDSSQNKPPDPPQLSPWETISHISRDGHPYLNLLSLPYYMTVKHETHLDTSWPYDPEYAKAGEPFAIPKFHARNSEQPHVALNRRILEALFYAARQGEQLKGKLPDLLEIEAVREQSTDLTQNKPWYYQSDKSSVTTREAYTAFHEEEHLLEDLEEVLPEAKALLEVDETTATRQAIKQAIRNMNNTKSHRAVLRKVYFTEPRL